MFTKYYAHFEKEVAVVHSSLFLVTVKIDWSKGSVSGAVYNGEEKLTKLLTEVLFAITSLDPKILF